MALVIMALFSKLRTALVLLFLDSIFFGFASPVGATSLIVIVGCALLALNTYFASHTLVRLVAKIIDSSRQTQKRTALLITITVMFLVLMQSIGQLSPRDVWAAALLAALLCAYIAYQSKHKSESQQPLAG